MTEDALEELEALIERIRRLPEGKLCYVDDVVRRLECGALSPLSLEAPRSTSDSQRLAAKVSAKIGGDKSPHSRDWPHAPTHRLSEHGTYIVTAGTLYKEHWFRGPDRLDLLESALLRILKQNGWQLEAWAVFSNHYHFVGHAGPGAKELGSVLKHLHADSSREVNGLDGTSDRAVWHNFWDTELTFQKSYLARLNYVHQNAVKHGLVPVASQYRWCSAGWFERRATRAQIRTIYGFKTDRVNVQDDFEPL
jgi:putative transposase